MPLCTVETNVTKENVPVDLHLKLVKTLAEILDKPIERISVTISPGLLMSRGATTDSTATVHIWSINVFNKESNPDYSKKLFTFFKKEWPELDEKRIVMSFHPIESHEVFSKN